MTEPRDPPEQDPLLALLREVNPLPDEAVGTAPGEAERNAAILERILASGGQRAVVVLPSARQVRRRRVAVAVAAAVAVATAAFAWAQTRHAGDPLGISCYAAFDPDADRVAVQADGRDPWDLCTEAWGRGHVIQGTNQAPTLTACVTDAGSIAVLPRPADRGCSDVGFTELEQGPPPGGSPAPVLAAVQQDLIERFHTAPCPALGAGKAIVQDVLAQHDLADWRIAGPDTAPPDRPCTSVAIDTASKTITVVPIPQPPPS